MIGEVINQDVEIGANQTNVETKKPSEKDDPKPDLPITSEEITKQAELPQTTEIPEFISDLIRKMASESWEDGKERQAMVFNMPEGLETTFYEVGKEGSVDTKRLQLQAYLRQAAVAYIHTHPGDNDSSSSPGDLEAFKSLNAGAFSFITVAENGVSVLRQTKESIRIPISSRFNGIRTGIKAQEVLIQSAKELHQALEPGKELDLESFNKGPKLGMAIRRYGQKVANVCEEAGYGYYRWEGNVTETRGKIALGRVKANQ